MAADNPVVVIRGPAIHSPGKHPGNGRPYPLIGWLRRLHGYFAAFAPTNSVESPSALYHGRPCPKPYGFSPIFWSNTPVNPSA